MSHPQRRPRPNLHHCCSWDRAWRAFFFSAGGAARSVSLVCVRVEQKQGLLFCCEHPRTFFDPNLTGTVDARETDSCWTRLRVRQMGPNQNSARVRRTIPLNFGLEIESLRVGWAERGARPDRAAGRGLLRQLEIENWGGKPLPHCCPEGGRLRRTSEQSRGRRTDLEPKRSQRLGPTRPVTAITYRLGAQRVRVPSTDRPVTSPRAGSCETRPKWRAIFTQPRGRVGDSRNSSFAALVTAHRSGYGPTRDQPLTKLMTIVVRHTHDLIVRTRDRYYQQSRNTGDLPWPNGPICRRRIQPPKPPTCGHSRRRTHAGMSVRDLFWQASR